MLRKLGFCFICLLSIHLGPEAFGQSQLPAFDLSIFGGVITPAGQLQDHAKSGAVYGVGVGKVLRRTKNGEFKINLLASLDSDLKAKGSDRSGSLEISTHQLRLDYRMPAIAGIKPFIGAGLGAYTWDGEINRPSTTQQNSGSRTEFGGLLALGADFPLSRMLSLAPEYTYHKIEGGFKEPLHTAWLRLRLHLQPK